MMKKNKNIIVSGWYGSGNVGDELIMEVISQELKQIHPNCKITVFSYNPNYTKEHQKLNAVYHLPYGIKSWFGRIFYNFRFWETIFAILKCDLFIMGGGGFLSDWQPEVPYMWLRECMWAKLLGKETVLYKIGAAPFLTERGCRTTRFFINNFVDKVIVREKFSYESLKNKVKINPDKLSIEIDPVAEMDTKNYKIEDDGYITVVYTKIYHDKQYWNDMSNRWEKLKQCYFVQVQTLLDEGQKIRLLFFQKGFDDDLAEEFKEKFKDKIEIIIANDYKEAILLIAKSKAVIGFRLHANIIAYALKKPFLPIIYHFKTRGFLDLIDFKQNDIVLETGDGLNWSNKEPSPEEWEEKTKLFLNMIIKNEKQYEEYKK